MKVKTVARKLNEQYGDIVCKAKTQVKSNYCKGLTKQELIDVGIIDVRFIKGKWLVYRLWYRNNTRVKELKIISITNAVGKHKYRPDKVYPKITFSTPRRKYNIPLSRLVYIWYNGDIPDGYVVDHIDNDSYNCSPDNLQLLTVGENLAKRYIDEPAAWTNQYGKPKGWKKEI